MAYSDSANIKCAVRFQSISRRVVEGGRYPSAPPLDIHPPRPPPLEPEAASSNVLNLNIYSEFFHFNPIDNVTICPFYDSFSNSFLDLNLLYNILLLLFIKDVMQGKLFQKCTHLLYCSVLSLGGNVNPRRMSKPDMGSLFHINNQ